MIDLNCDLGEAESPEVTQALLRVVTSANIACGGHAGDVSSMHHCLRLAARYGVRAGAHPGESADGGRGSVSLTRGAFAALVSAQVGRLERIARHHGIALHHIKLHGSLYHATEADPDLRREFISLIGHRWRHLRIFARAGGSVVADAQRHGLDAWDEVYADRGYDDAGTLVARGQPGALLTSASAVRERVFSLRLGGALRSRSDRPLRLPVRTICVHGDTPNALSLATSARWALGSRLG